MGARSGHRLDRFPTHGRRPHGEGGRPVVGWEKGNIMSVQSLFLVIVLFLLITSLPTWPYSRNWGYYPSGGLGLVLLVLIILMLI
jgi:hypothetical protein